MRRMHTLSAAAGSLLAATLASTSSQAIVDEAGATARVALTTAQIAERPLSAQTPADAAGDATVTLDRARHEVNFVIRYDRLSGPATAIHFHRGAKGRFGPIVQHVCGKHVWPGPAPISDAACPEREMTGVWRIPPEMEAALEAGELFLLVHTVLNYFGEVRGQIVFDR